MQREDSPEARPDYYGLWPYVAGVMLGAGLMALMFGLAI